MRRNRSIFNLVRGAVIAALYVVLTWLSSVLGLSSGAVQLRFSEALCVLPLFMPGAAVPGLTVGCLLANLLTGAPAPDVIFGTGATLLGALGTWGLRAHPRLALLPPIASNTVIVPLVLRYAYGFPDAVWSLALTVGLGEVLSVGVLGSLLCEAIRRRPAMLGTLDQ